jgi:hypothetical protein
MKVLGEVLGAVPELRPPARDIDSAVMRGKRVSIPDTHAFTTTDANAEENSE